MNARVLLTVLALVGAAFLVALLGAAWQTCETKTVGTSRSTTCDSVVPEFLLIAIPFACVGGAGFVLGRAYPKQGGEKQG